ncbi:hypothetical protein CHGG_02360 [Chaetomium globosum CBS 148.51]|uniref:Uncharacterized protein n=1 Tax=Chaetomium globosum (strain ATCC 6205 / CBS 148.51 / DSM 1962 / NBRC 6347 / NRRL 1970) TaxID=306901 RepID=Q2HBP4_CHAGB|nr:uncharacterized protein CHGG_02360 [Chaetomium globosum CBS 148.51]EAQ90425.1 hypothetical protein CHGG_02360 [Chaetomium globosum CBS 148.51]
MPNDLLSKVEYQCALENPRDEGTKSALDLQVTRLCHTLALDALHERLVAIEDASMISEEERNIARYIVEVHNFANKGIKGRGVGRVVSRLLPCPSTAANFSGTGPADGTRLVPGDAMPLLARGLPA